MKDLSKLPEIILGDQIYNQDMQHNRQIFIVVRKKNVSIEELNEALSHCKSETKALLTRIENFTDEEDKEVLHILEQQLKARFPDSQDFVLKSDSQINKKEPIDDEESSDSQFNKKETIDDEESKSIHKALSCDFILNISQFNVGKQELEATSGFHCEENAV